MPESTQTPASRRFLPPSSSSRLKNNLSSSSRKPQFASNSQLPPSSPFLHTRTSYQERQSDVIDSTNDKLTNSPSTSATRKSYKTPPYCKHDSIEDDGSWDTTFQAHDKAASHLAIDHSEDEDSDAEIQDLTGNLRADYSSPLPKRQKLSHFTIPDTTVNNATVSVSSEDEHTLGGVRHDTAAGGCSTDLGSDQTGSLHRQDLSPQKIENRHKDGEGRRSDGEKQSSSTRTAFKGVSTHGSPWKETPLPATFSPSKRRGRYEYTYGGAAEAVRNWVLDIANDQGRSVETETEHIEVTPDFVDNSHRFEVVNDHEGQQWLLVHQDLQRRVLSDVSKEDESKYKSILVKGSQTTWDLEIADSTSMPDALNILRVSVLWAPER